MDEELAAKAIELANAHRLHISDALAIALGKTTLTDVRARTERQRRGSEIFALADAEWPDVALRWDLDAAQFHHSLDGEDAASFSALFPDAEASWVDASALCDCLVDISRRRESPFAPRYRSKTAELVAHLESGGKISPPLIRHDPQGLFVAGGNHRLALALHRGDPELPILVCRTQRAAIETLVPLRAAASIRDA